EITSSNEQNLTVFGSDFITSQEEDFYEINAFLKKDSNNYTAKIQVKVVDDYVPVLEVKCVDVELCFPNGDNVIINPTVRLAAIAVCIEGCKQNMIYNWTVKGKNGSNYDDELQEISYDESFYPVG
ncbi:unnamed protein product, partial [Meganyctiphanes norvegica]